MIDHEHFTAVQTELVDLLEQATLAGRARWACRSVDIGWVHCFVGREMLHFDVHGPDGKLCRQDADIAGIVLHFRNHDLLWLQGLYGWERLVPLVRAAPFDDERWLQFFEESQLSELENLVAQLRAP